MSPRSCVDLHGCINVFRVLLSYVIVSGCFVGDFLMFHKRRLARRSARPSPRREEKTDEPQVSKDTVQPVKVSIQEKLLTSKCF